MEMINALRIYKENYNMRAANSHIFFLLHPHYIQTVQELVENPTFTVTCGLNNLPHMQSHVTGS